MSRGLGGGGGELGLEVDDLGAPVSHSLGDRRHEV